jgi:hypothetical protein
MMLGLLVWGIMLAPQRRTVLHSKILSDSPIDIWTLRGTGDVKSINAPKAGNCML